MDEKIKSFLSEVRLVVQGDIPEGEAFASKELNPTLRWMKFILTDDKPNGNKQRVPQEEFPNIIQTGVHMPIKMAEGEIADGHEDARPIGVITNLTQVTNRIEGLAALWSRERPDDIEYVLKQFESGSPPQISYEMPFTDSKYTEEGIEELNGVVLGAATFVKFPAYEGRTPVIAMAAKDKTGESNTNLEETQIMDELEILQGKLDEANDKVKELESQLAEKTEAEASLNEELTELREYKAEAEKVAAEVERLEAIEEKFAEAGIEKDKEYFDEKRDTLLALDDTAIDFMVQEMVSFAEKKEDKLPDLDNDAAIPPITGEKPTNSKTLEAMVEALNESLK
jgi:hypothetical protein